MEARARRMCLVRETNTTIKGGLQDGATRLAISLYERTHYLVKRTGIPFLESAESQYVDENRHVTEISQHVAD
jgi:hypothetical protein